MNANTRPRNREFENSDEELAFLSRAIQFIDESLDAGEIDRFNAELLESDTKLASFAELQLLGSVVRKVMRQSAYALPESPLAIQCQSSASSKTKRRLIVVLASLAVVASVLLMVGSYLVGKSRGHHASANSSDASAARLVGSSHARFFGEFVPLINSFLISKRDYVLNAGVIELAFPKGATAIIESPAVFRIIDDACLAMDAGQCSVYAPEGAEGFRVETPTTRVVDRGTRFVVSVGEDASTEVQVIEGAADVYQEADQDVAIHLTRNEAKHFSAENESVATEVPFAPRRFQSGLPDRIVGYEAVTLPSGRVSELQSVTVQRAGRIESVPVADLIDVTLTHFRAGPERNRNGHFACDSMLPQDRRSLLADGKLNTGIINPGGSTTPLQSTPNAETPGFAVRFASPVFNGPGPDVVFFELQSVANPLDGDAFHVSPAQFLENSKSHTIRRYDLTLASLDARPIADFSLYRFKTPIHSVQQLMSESLEGNRVHLGFRALAVGIDLSDLGLVEGESIEELFFQDAADDVHIVDPVFIAGLPIFEAHSVHHD
jgi:hypothetical protein